MALYQTNLMKGVVYKFLLICSCFAYPEAHAYDPFPSDVREFVSKKMPHHEFLDTDFHEVVKTFYGYSEDNPFPKYWSLDLNFNNDGVTDWVGYLVYKLKKERLPLKAVGLYCICSTGSSYTPILLGDFEWHNLEEGVLFNLVKWLPGTYENVDQSITVTVTTEVVLVDTFLDPVGEMYYWDGSKAQSLVLSD